MAVRITTDQIRELDAPTLAAHDRDLDALRARLADRGVDTEAVITITDNGTGISAKDVPRVFNRFDRVVEAGVRGEAALGLGLPLTRQFIEAHGGSVDLKSKKGKGTTVTLTVPRGAK